MSRIRKTAADRGRREFVKTTSLGAGALGLLHGCRRGRAPASQTGIVYRQLGRTNIRLPIVSMGVMNASVPEVVEESYKIGVRHFDTAWVYQRGNNERMVGDVVTRLGVRPELIIATKVRGGRDGDESPEALRAILEERFAESLQRLQTTYVDILYYHNVRDGDALREPLIREMFEKLKSEKKIRYCGVSMHSNQAEVLEAAIEQGYLDVVLVAINYARDDVDVILPLMKRAADAGIGVIAMKTQGGGRRSDEEQGDEKPINQTAMLKWVLRHEFITTAIPGYTNFDHMKQDFSVAYGIDYTPEEEQFLKDENTKLSLGFCQQCERCLPTCPFGVDIPAMMRTYMYAFQYGNTQQAAQTYAESEPGRRLEACGDCSGCTAACARSVPVARRVSRLKNLSFV